jgi:hypothetical protein
MLSRDCRTRGRQVEAAELQRGPGPISKAGKFAHVDHVYIGALHIIM